VQNFPNDSNFLVRGIWRGRDVQLHGLKMTEALWEVEGGDGDRNPVCKYFGKTIVKVYLVCFLMSLNWQQMIRIIWHSTGITEDNMSCSFFRLGNFSKFTIVFPGRLRIRVHRLTDLRRAPSQQVRPPRQGRAWPGTNALSDEKGSAAHRAKPSNGCGPQLGKVP